MSEKDSGKKNAGSNADADVKPGRGLRSLQTWQRLAAAREAARSDDNARAQLETDPTAFFQQFGVAGLAPEEGMTDLERRLGALNPFEAEQGMALQYGARRGVAAVAVFWAGVIAVNAAKAANVAWHFNAAANFNANANANANANFNYNWNAAAGV